MIASAVVCSQADNQIPSGCSFGCKVVGYLTVPVFSQLSVETLEWGGAFALAAALLCYLVAPRAGLASGGLAVVIGIWGYGLAFGEISCACSLVIIALDAYLVGMVSVLAGMAFVLSDLKQLEKWRKKVAD